MAAAGRWADWALTLRSRAVRSKLLLTGIHRQRQEAERPMVVLTALDGILGDRNPSGFGAATEALDVLGRYRIPLVLYSSRTRAEIERLQQDLGMLHPFISENGGALFIPEGYFAFSPHRAQRRAGYEVLEFGRPYLEVVEALRAAAVTLGLQVVGFSDLSIEEVAHECGLSLSQARLAKLREYDEPFRILDEATHAQQSRFLTVLRRVGLRCSSNGLFRHVTGVADRRESVRAATSLYCQAWGDVLTIGLGAQVDDLSLLQEVEIPVVVQSTAVDVTTQVLRKIPIAHATTAEGIQGWSEAILNLVNRKQSSAACQGLGC